MTEYVTGRLPRHRHTDLVEWVGAEYVDVGDVEATITAVEQAARQELTTIAAGAQTT